jgi:hypothetical protein
MRKEYKFGWDCLEKYFVKHSDLRGIISNILLLDCLPTLLSADIKYHEVME